MRVGYRAAVRSRHAAEVLRFVSVSNKVYRRVDVLYHASGLVLARDAADVLITLHFSFVNEVHVSGYLARVRPDDAADVIFTADFRGYGVGDAHDPSVFCVVADYASDVAFAAYGSGVPAVTDVTIVVSDDTADVLGFIAGRS